MDGQEPMKESHVEVKMPEKGAHLSEEGVIPLAATEGLNIFHLSKPNPFLKGSGAPQESRTDDAVIHKYECCGEIVRNGRAFHRTMRGVFDDGTCPGAKATCHKLYKYIIAKMYLGFAWLPHYRRVQVNVWVFDYLRREGFFTPQEAEQIANIHKNAKPFGMIAKWIQLLLHREQQRGDISELALDRLMTNIRGLNRHLGILNEYASMPVPFAFYHLLNVMAIGYLLLLAYTQVFSSYFYGIFPMALTTLVTLGLRELCNGTTAHRLLAARQTRGRASSVIIRYRLI
ncbi:hypothetical protein KFL_000360010 [Klebsormidium nitens]|uniref:Uncharacterized protein n=1 Tax=Klebsormidium nitens TaxID=105231 RepID=A0A1Y1HM24_KLENI|nr:hypothetical protein KFL_000360010 [Klebsormidium nitens]|eukprot:GAQ79685.1 hypothetical protein KFL_000360010 [Klebsormidium nitens]